MAEEKIYGVLEGADCDDVERTHYTVIDFPVSEHLKVLSVRKTRLPLHVMYDPLSGDHFFRNGMPPQDAKGVPLLDPRYAEAGSPDWIDWVYEMPRAVVTRRGRIYINELFYERGWEFYRSKIHQIAQDCSSLFRGEIGAEELHERSWRLT